MVLSATMMHLRLTHSHAKAQPSWFIALAFTKFRLRALREIYPHYLSIGVRG